MGYPRRPWKSSQARPRVTWRKSFGHKNAIRTVRIDKVDTSPEAVLKDMQAGAKNPVGVVHAHTLNRKKNGHHELVKPMSWFLKFYEPVCPSIRNEVLLAKPAKPRSCDVDAIQDLLAELQSEMRDEFNKLNGKVDKIMYARVRQFPVAM